MAWSKVKYPTEKPLIWWYHKVMCEFGWMVRSDGFGMYYKHLNKLCDLGWNLYGDRITSNKKM